MDSSFIRVLTNPRVFDYGAAQRSPADEELLRQTRIGVQEIREANRRMDSLEAEADEYEDMHEGALGRVLRQFYRPRDPVIAGARGSSFFRAARMLSMADRPSEERLSALGGDETQFDDPTVQRLFRSEGLDYQRADLITGLERSEDEKDRQRVQRLKKDIRQREKHIKKVASKKEEEALEERAQEDFRIRRIVTELNQAHQAAGYDMFDFAEAQRQPDP
jgi:hypothetical protein